MDIKELQPNNGRVIKEDNSIVNVIDVLDDIKTSIDNITVEFDDTDIITKLDMIIALIAAPDLLKTKLGISGTIIAATTFLTNNSGVNYTKTGDSIYLGATDVEFNANNNLKFLLNGVEQEKGVNVIFVTSYSFYLDVAVNNTDIINIIKG